MGLLSLLRSDPVSVNPKVLSLWGGGGGGQRGSLPPPERHHPIEGLLGLPPSPCVQLLSTVWLCHPLLSRTVTFVPVALRCWDGFPRFPTLPGLHPSSACR